MKRTIALVFAALSFVVASSVQAGEVNFEFYSQANEASRLQAAKGVNFTLIDVNGDKVAEGQNQAHKVVCEVEPGNYTLVVEQISTRFFGSLEFGVEEVSEPFLFQLNRSGLSLIENAHSCPHECDGTVEGCEVKAGHGICECDADCICKRICDACDANGDYAANGGVDYPANSQAPSTITSNTTPVVNSNLPSIPTGATNGGLFGGGSSIGALGTLGLIGAVIAVAVADDQPIDNPSAFVRYR